MKVHDCVQGTPEWLALRTQCPTASELGNIIAYSKKTQSYSLRSWKDEMPESYLAHKLAERWLGHPLQSFDGGAMEQGSILEDEAIPWYELEYRMTLERPGFITTNDGSFGCSPDGIYTDGGMGIEIKSPQPNTHVKWLMGGGCPEKHVLQCQGGMYVTNWALWTFVSYCRGFPPLVVRLERDDEIQEQIFKATTLFSDRFKAEWARLVERNGGKEPKRKAPKPVVERDSDPFAANECVAPDTTQWR